MADNKRLETYLNTNSIHYFMESGTKHMFVLNNSYEYSTKKNELCSIILPVDDNLICKIPASKLPFDLTEQAPFDKLIESHWIRSYLSKRLILICPEDKAFEVLEKPESQKEMAKLRETISDLSEMYKQEEITVQDAPMVTNQPEALEVDLTVLEVLNKTDLTEDEKYVAIKNIEDRLQPKDWQYVYENGEEKLKELATSKL